MQRWARPWFGAMALLVLVTMVIQLRAVGEADTGFFDSDAKRLANVFCFFTIWSNLLVGATSAALAIRLERPSLAFRSAYLAATVMIVVTFVVVIVALDPISEYEGKAATADFLTHKLVPVLAVAGWVAFAPRRMFDTAAVRASLVIPVVWLVFTLVRGPFASDFYPYPFIDVVELGYPRTLGNVAVVSLLLLALSSGARVVDQRLSASPEQVDLGT